MEEVNHRRWQFILRFSLAAKEGVSLYIVSILSAAVHSAVTDMTRLTFMPSVTWLP